MHANTDSAVDATYRADWGRIVATLIRLVGDFDVAEDAAQEAFAAAAEQWRTAGVPAFPRAWIIQTARHKAIDRIRRRARLDDKMDAYVAPGGPEMPERLDAVLTVIYLVFTEGYAPTRGDVVRTDLCAEAIRLGRLVRGAMAPRPPAEVTGLLALMLLHDARREARLDTAGDVVLLENQDRGRWNKGQIAEALPLVEDALRAGPGPLSLQAAIAALHCQAARPEDTDWRQIVRLYDLLERLQPSPVVSLNRAVAVAMVDGPQPALALIDALAATGDLDDYHLLHAARADLLRRAGSSEEAAKSYARALALVTNDSERRFLERRLREVQPPA